MKLSDKLNNRLARRDIVEAKANAKAQLAKKTLDTDSTCPNCNKEMQPTTAGDNLALACYDCRICLPRNS